MLQIIDFERLTNKGMQGQTRPVAKPVADGSRENIGKNKDPQGGATPNPK